jgi:hypothetical protein
MWHTVDSFKFTEGGMNNTNEQDFRTLFNNAKRVYIDGQEVGRVWYEEDTDWNCYINLSDSLYDFIDSEEDAIQNVIRSHEHTESIEREEYDRLKEKYKLG